MKNQNKIVILLLIIACVIGYDFVFQYPKRKTLINNQISAKATLKTNLYEAENAMEKIPIVKKETANLLASLSELLDRFPPRGKTGLIMDIITSSIPEEMRIEAISPRSLKELTSKVPITNEGELITIKYEESEIKIDFKCSFQKFGNFLKNVEDSKYFFKVSQLSIKTVETEKYITGTILLKTISMDPKL